MKVSLTFYLSGLEYREKGIRLGDNVTVSVKGAPGILAGRVTGDTYNEVQHDYILVVEVQCGAWMFGHLERSSPDDWTVSKLQASSNMPIAQSHPLLN